MMTLRKFFLTPIALFSILGFSNPAYAQDLDCEGASKYFKECESNPKCDPVARGFQKNFDSCVASGSTGLASTPRESLPTAPKTDPIDPKDSKEKLKEIPTDFTLYLGLRNPKDSKEKLKDSKEKLKDSKEKLKEIQYLLNKNGYNVGSVDGIFGPKTCSAISNFSRTIKQVFQCDYSDALRDALLGTRSEEDKQCEETVEKDIKHCQQILNDVKGMIAIGMSKEMQAWDAADKAAVQSYDCSKGVYQITRAAFKDCNLLNPPGVDPRACVEAVIGIPDTIEVCGKAIEAIDNTIAYYKQANFYYGTAGIAFDDQGGEELSSRLEDCGVTSCQTNGIQMSQDSEEGEKRTDRNLNSLNLYRNMLESINVKFEKCLSEPALCEELRPSDFPILESPPNPNIEPLDFFSPTT